MYRYACRYVGPLRAVVLDWSGTLIDPYSAAPADALKELFERRGVPISGSEARISMGMRKDKHIMDIASMSRVRKAWQKQYGRPPNAGDLSDLFAEFVTLQREMLPNYAQMLPGSLGALKRLQSVGIKIGVTTGFTRCMVDSLLPAVEAQGFRPDATVAGDDVEHGNRPRPFMLFRAMELMDAWPVEAVLKVDDTTLGVEEGLTAGCWAAGVANYSAHAEIDSTDHATALGPGEVDRRRDIARDRLTRAGAHYVIDSVADVPTLITKINARLRTNE